MGVNGSQIPHDKNQRINRVAKTEAIKIRGRKEQRAMQAGAVLQPLVAQGPVPMVATLELYYKNY